MSDVGSRYFDTRKRMGRYLPNRKHQLRGDTSALRGRLVLTAMGVWR